MLFNFILWLLYWFGGTMIFYYCLHWFSYHRRPILVCLYFLLISLLPIGLAPDRFQALIKNVSVAPIIILALMFATTAVIYVYSYRGHGRQIMEMKQQPDKYFVRMDYRYLISKAFEIIWQQTAIIALIFIIYSQIDYSQSTFYLFALIFALTHLPLYLLMERKVAALFLLSSFLSGLVFPYLILKINYGFVYTFSLHWLFYFALAVYSVLKPATRINQNSVALTLRARTAGTGRSAG